MLAAPPKGRTMKKLIAVILLGLLLLPSTTNADSPIKIIDKTGDGYWVDDTWQVSLYPGETAKTTLSIRNNTANPMEVELGISPDGHYDEVKFRWDDDEFTIKGKHTVDATLYVKVSGSAAPGKYTGELTIEWKKEKVKPHRPWWWFW